MKKLSTLAHPWPYVIHSLSVSRILALIRGMLLVALDHSRTKVERAKFFKHVSDFGGISTYVLRTFYVRSTYVLRTFYVHSTYNLSLWSYLASFGYT